MPLVTIDIIDEGRACPYCRFRFEVNSIAYKCDVCGSLHHEDCWAEGSGCAMLGCQMNAASMPHVEPHAATESNAFPPIATAGDAQNLPPVPATKRPVGGPLIGSHESRGSQFYGTLVATHSVPLADSRVIAAIAALPVAVFLWIFDLVTELSSGAFFTLTSQTGWILVGSVWPAFCCAILGGGLIVSRRWRVGAWESGLRDVALAVPLLMAVAYVAIASVWFARWEISDAFYSLWIARMLEIAQLVLCGAVVGAFVGRLPSGSMDCALRCGLGGAIGGFAAGVVLNLGADSWGEPTGGLFSLLVFSMSIALGATFTDVLTREAWLRISDGQFNGADLTLANQVTSVGSAPECDVCVTHDRMVAPAHAWIERVHDAYTVKAAGDAQLMVNDAQVSVGQLTSGDVITVGTTKLQFQQRQHRSNSAIRLP